MNDFYDGNKLLTTRDKNNLPPEISISIGNRSGGKTTFFNKWFVRRYMKYSEKFILIFRYQNELERSFDNFSAKILNWFPNTNFTSKIDNSFLANYYINGENCGWGIALNSCDKVKKMSHLLSSAERMLFDEFLPESGKFLKNEVEKLLSIHISIARSVGCSSKFLPIYMIANNVSIINPYFTKLGISKLIDNKEYYKGVGWVLEMKTVENASKQLMESSFNKAFSNKKYMDYVANNVTLLSNEKQIIAAPSNLKPLAKILLNTGEIITVYKCSLGLFINESHSAITKYNFTNDYLECDEKFQHISSNKLFRDTLITFLNKGKIFYSCQTVKNLFIDFLS